jgi:hypothetical protein
MISVFFIDVIVSHRQYDLLEELNGISILSKGDSLNNTELRHYISLHELDLEKAVERARRNGEVGLVQLGGD